MKQLSLTVAALLAGFVGGILGMFVVRAREQQQPGRIVRARSFELVDEAGRAISFWGLDRGHNAVLTFGRGGALPGNAPFGLENPDNQRAAIGLTGDNAFLELRGADGKMRARLDLGLFGKPLLWMADETGPRLGLGVEQSDTPGPQDNDWTLDFGPESRARIGMYAEREGGQTYVRGIFSVKKDKVKYPYNQP